MDNYKEKYERSIKVLESKMQDFDEITINREDVEEIFPELAESEDEKVRKALVDALNKNLGNGIEKYGTTFNAALAWLEKHGEKKPADKVEPKFKVGDWIITNKNHIWYVDETPEATSYLYRLINQYGKVEVAEFEIVDEKARLWTIEDAKDGDVLQLGNVTAIFKKYIGQGHCLCYWSLSMLLFC